MRKTQTEKEPKYWLWVTRPEVFLDKNAKDTSYLDPQKKVYKGSEWSCHKETKKGDLVLLWRSKSKLSTYLRSSGIKKAITPTSDIGYLIRAESNADGPRKNEPWPFWCYYKPLYKFENPVTIEDFKNNPTLRESLPYKVHFVRNSFPLSKEEWDIVNQIAIQKNPRYKKFYETLLNEKIARVPKIKPEIEIPAEAGEKTHKKRELYLRKYGGAGEGDEHKKFKEWVAENPKSIGLFDVKGSPKKECSFISGDMVDILFEREDGKFAVVEIETDNPEPGFYQALKYKILKCAEAKIDITSPDVKAILVAWSVPDSLKELCNQYNVEFHEIRREKYN